MKIDKKISTIIIISALIFNIGIQAQNKTQKEDAGDFIVSWQNPNTDNKNLFFVLYSVYNKQDFKTLASMNPVVYTAMTEKQKLFNCNYLINDTTFFYYGYFKYIVNDTLKYIADTPILYINRFGFLWPSNVQVKRK